MVQREVNAVGTTYSFRGPRSHRAVNVFVASSDEMMFRESYALRIANNRAAINEIRRFVGEPTTFIRTKG